MQLLRHHLRRLTWIALVAIFGLALAPTLSHALTAGTAANPFSEICSAVGAKSGSGIPAGVPAGMAHLQHCPLCGPSAGALGMPAAVVVAAPASSRATVATAPASTALSPHGWTLAQPRAPPSIS